MAILNLHHYGYSKISQNYWDAIANFLSCCENDYKNISEESFTYIRWNEKKVCFESLLYSLDIPRELHNQIAEEIRCPECGGKISLNSFVSINMSYESERNRQKLEAKVNQTVRGDIKRFIKYLNDFPMLGLQNDIGQEIKKAIKETPTIFIHDEDWFRGRKPELENPLRIFTKNDMNKPPANKTKEGRFNHYGQPVLYLGSSDTICAKEINEGDEEVICWIQKVLVKKANILDLTNKTDSKEFGKYPLLLAGLLISGELTKHDSNRDSYYKPEYAITRYIADLCRLNNIDGIKYISTHKEDGDRNPYNLVLFNDDCYELIGEPLLHSGNERKLFSCEMEGVKIQFKVKR